MDGILRIILAIIVSVEYIIGNLVNGFIAVVNFMGWAKRRKISSTDQICTALAISRVVFLWLLFLHWWVFQFHADLLMNTAILQIISVSWTVVSHFSTWLATCLSLFYLLKIANFSNSPFLYLKWRVTKVVPVTLLVSLILLFLNIFIIEIYNDEWTSEYKTIMFYNSSNSTKYARLLFIPETVFTLVPLMVSLITFILLIYSLWKHLKTMGYHVRGSRDISTKAHIKALKTVTASLLLSITFHLVLILYMSDFEYMSENLIVSFLVLSILIVTPLSHTFILILGSNNLKQASISMLMWQKCWSKDVGPSHS